MRLATLAVGRLSSRACFCSIPAAPSTLLRSTKFASRIFRNSKYSFPKQQKQAWRARYTLLAAANGALGTAAFVQLSEEEEAGSDLTGEQRMLQVSREEIKKTVSSEDRGFSRFRHQCLLFLDLYVWEPICTGVRFLHLVVIFVPVILSVPAIWIGRRKPDRDNERSGTLWWYGFLVKSSTLR